MSEGQVPSVCDHASALMCAGPHIPRLHAACLEACQLVTGSLEPVASVADHGPGSRNPDVQGSAAATGVALINSIANMGGMIGPAFIGGSRYMIASQSITQQSCPGTTLTTSQKLNSEVSCNIHCSRPGCLLTQHPCGILFPLPIRSSFF